MEVLEMRLSVEDRRRLQELAREAKGILGGCLHTDGRPMTFAELEEECIEAGDLLTAALLEERVGERKLAEKASYCPNCGRQGEPSPDEPRVLQTDRGEVCWLEPTYYCRHCRRAFFPAFGRIGFSR
jgi:hypothetical protein